MTLKTLTIALVAICAATSAWARDIRVPGDAITIQAAIDIAAPGDTVLVGPGWWNESIDLKGKPLTLRSIKGAKETLLDGEALDNSVLVCVTGEGPATIIEGFTITRGSGNSELYGERSTVGGGILILASSPTIRDCVFMDNDANFNGGAAYLAKGSKSRFENCTFLENASEKGGGVYSVQSEPRFIGCRFLENEGRYSGGGVYIADGGAARFENCRFERNRANYYGGAFYAYGSSSHLSKCTFDRNRATYKGGAIYNGYKGKSKTTDCTFLTVYDDISGGTIPPMTAVDPTGACLMADGNCLIISKQSCEDAAGTYRGDKTDCVSSRSDQLARSSDLNDDGLVDDRDALMLLLLWR